MGTLLKFYEYSEFGDSSHIIGYCKEQPIEVLQKIIKTHRIHSYKTTYCPTIEKYPSHIGGLMILEFEDKKCEMYGIQIIKSVDDYLDTEILNKYKLDKFSMQDFLNSVNREKKKYLKFDDTNRWKQIHKNIYIDFSNTYSKLMKEGNNND